MLKEGSVIKNYDNNISNRIVCLDIAKGIAILFMVVGHCNHFFGYESNVMVIIYGFHMPLFVILSGITLWVSDNRKDKPSSFILMIKKKAFSLLIPYFIVGFISILLSDGSNAMKHLATLVIGEAATSDMNYNLPLWFLPMLFLNEIIFSLYKNIKSKVVISLISFMLSGIGFFMITRKMILPWSFDIALFCQFFILIGYICAPFIINFAQRNKLSIKETVLLICSCIFFIVTYIIVVFRNGRVDLNARRVNNVSLYVLHSLFGSMPIIALSILIEKVKFFSIPFSMIGTHSLDILCWHVPLSSLFYSYFVGRFPSAIQQYIWGQSMDYGLEY